MEVSIIIVNWNSKDFLRKCLASLSLHCTRSSFEVIVVDSASFDGCGEMLAKDFPQVRFIQSDKNLGFGRCNNLGAKYAAGELLWFLNPDTELNHDTLSTLKTILNNSNQAGAISGLLLNPDGSVQAGCIQSFPTVLNQVLDSEYLRAKYPKSGLWGMAALFNNEVKPAIVEAVCGASILIKKTVFQQINGFSDYYFMYGEDLDLCFKVKQSGHDVLFDPSSILIHHGGISTQKARSNLSNVMMRESVYRFLKINRGVPTAFAYRLALGLCAAARVLAIGPLYLVTGRKVVTHGNSSIKKWTDALKWSLGLQSWVKEYD